MSILCVLCGHTDKATGCLHINNPECEYRRRADELELVHKIEAKDNSYAGIGEAARDAIEKS